MELSELQSIIKITTLMNEYQKINEIKGMCSANTSFIYNIICDNYPTLKLRTKVEPVICHYIRKIDNNGSFDPVFHIHLVIKIDEKKLIDPSYELDSIEDNLYLDGIKTFQAALIELKKTYGLVCSEAFKKYIIKDYLDFVDIAKDINANNGDLLFTPNKKYSDNLKNYVIENYNEKYGMIYISK